MKIQIRQGVFETNSSSTHVLSVITKSEWNEFKNSEDIFIDWWDTREFISREKLWKKFEEFCKENDQEPSEDDFDEWLRYDGGFFNYDQFSDEYEILTEEIPDSPYIAISIYGYE